MMATSTQALQARVQKLLGSRAELEATRALLGTLVTSEGSGGIAEGSDPRPEALVSMTAASGIASLADLRRNLRTSLEHKQLTLAETALTDLVHTLEQITALADRVDSLDAKCSRVQSFLETTKRETQQVQAEAAALATKRYESGTMLPLGGRSWGRIQVVTLEVTNVYVCRDQVQQEWSEARAFLDRYQLSEDEVRALYAENLADGDMDAFFGTLERVRQVKTDCKALVATGDVNCGLELLDAVGKYQEAGFERLYQWTARKCAEVDGEPSNMLHRAITLLSDRAEFYKYVVHYCKECLTASRRSLIVRRFIMALTVGGPNGIPRPIEMHAHDPVRYCGDMLAWVHQAIATESEFFRVLFDGDIEFTPPSQSASPAVTNDPNSDASAPAIVDNVSSSGEMTKPVSEDEVCTSMVGRAFDGVSRPLQVRVEQTLGSPHGIVIAYKLVHLLAFYHHKFGQLVAHAEVARALGRCREAANEAFHRQFQQLVDAVAASAQDYAASLMATHTTLDVAHRLVALLEVFQSSLLPEREKEADLAPLFDGVLPAIELMCQRSVTGLDAVDALVFRINNWSCLQAPLTRFPEVAKWSTAMSRDVDRWLRDLGDLQATRLLDRCRVSALLQRIQEFQQSHAAVAAETPGLDGETISRVMGDFCAALMTLLFPQLDHVAQPQLADKARALTSATLAGTYAFIYEFVYDARHGYIPSSEPPSSSTSWASAERNRHVVLLHTPEEVRTVLDIDEEAARK
ncbi:hypothetical protein BBJ28_00002991 [Nothophytophthora sp. Chile5]|nr:hypothetical protein BBJ28_00002991 [Nothophytophthora sp. Chile5]